MSINIVKQKFIIEENKLEDYLEVYKNLEYIPIKIIDTILLYAFPSFEIVHQYSSQHKIIKIKIADLLEAPIRNWEYNRPPDRNRCYDISRYIYASKNGLDTMLYFNFNNKKRSFDIIDGIHRYTALQIIKENNSNPIDLITPGEFGNNDDAKWLYDSYIIANIRFNALEGEIIELFKNLNKSTPIPELYIRDTTKEKREIIESTANNWQIKYKSHFSPNNKPNKPNINRDRFIDLLEQIYDKYKITSENKQLLEQLLDRINTSISFDIPRKTSKQIKEKCSVTGCWLFIYSYEKLLTMI
jgi:hypothetical protein